MSSVELPAILGGTPTFPEGPPPWPRADTAVQAALHEAIASGSWGKYHGEHICRLEEELASFHGVSHALTCASGTLAVEAALRALRVGPGDEVVQAAYDYESNFLTLHAVGAKPVLIDVAPHNWQLNPAALEAAITPQTKAVICSHLHGGLVPMREVMTMCSRRGIGVVEDAAQSPGAVVQGKPAGTWGDVGTLSFGGSKLLTAGRGGAMLFRDSQLFQRAKLWLQRGLQQWAPLSELQAAALRPQLHELRSARLSRFERVQQLDTELERNGVMGLSRFVVSTEDVPAFYKVGFRYDSQAFGLSRELFVQALRAEGVAFDAGFTALHVNRSPSRFRARGELVHAFAAHEGCVMLHHPVLAGRADDVQRVADAIGKVFRFRERIAASGRD